MRRAALVLLVAFVGCGDTSPAGDAEQEETPEYKLAVIDSGEPVEADSPQVREYGRALDLLEAKCDDERIRLSDYAVRSQQLMQERNVDESLLDILRNVRASIPDEVEAGDIQCSEIFATYVTLRTSTG